MEDEFEVFFPKISDSIQVKQYYSLLQKRVLLQLKKVQGQDTTEQMSEIDDEILGMYKPKTFQGKASFEVRLIKNFEEAVIFLAQHMSRDPKGLTVLEFYQALETISGQNKKQKNG